jgi:hypothetical protein
MTVCKPRSSLNSTNVWLTVHELLLEGQVLPRTDLIC